VTLEQLFQGCRLEAAVTRTVLADPTKFKPALCPECNGTGVVTMTRRLGPGIMQQVNGTCRRCGGYGLDGSSIREEGGTVEVSVEAGMMDGTRIRCRSQGSIGMNGQRGDVLVTIRQADHLTFQRHRRHLILSRKVSLAEALMGTRFCVPTLDGSELWVSTAPPHLIRPGSLFMLLDAGMPVHEDPSTRGALIVAFEVSFPKDGELTVGQLRGLRKAFDTQLPGGAQGPHEQERPSSKGKTPRLRSPTSEESGEASQDLESVWRQENSGRLVPLDRNILQQPAGGKRPPRSHDEGKPSSSTGSFFQNIFGGRGRKARL
jgi:DnaJ-class molecular chaperone